MARVAATLALPSTQILPIPRSCQVPVYPQQNAYAQQQPVYQQQQPVCVERGSPNRLFPPHLRRSSTSSSTSRTAAAAAAVWAAWGCSGRVLPWLAGRLLLTRCDGAAPRHLGTFSSVVLTHSRTLKPGCGTQCVSLLWLGIKSCLQKPSPDPWLTRTSAVGAIKNFGGEALGGIENFGGAAIGGIENLGGDALGAIESIF